MSETVYIQFDGAGPEKVFMDIVDEDGRSIDVGEWEDDDAHPRLKLEVEE